MYEEHLTPSARRKRCRAAISAYTPAENPGLNPCKKIPNVQSFKVTRLSNYHPTLLKVGIRKRETHPQFETVPYINHSINRYLEHQFIRLNKCRNVNPDLYWLISEHLLKRSSCFMALCLYETDSGWHRTRSYEDIWKYIRSARELNFSSYEHYLVQIDKPGTNEKRPLNVPTYSWRLFLHGLNNILMVWLDSYQSLYQHGFLKHRGTSTAWKQIHQEVLTSDNIYEFDLRKFFDNINLDYLKDLLMRLDLPPHLVNYIILWSRTPPDNSTHSLQRWDTPQEEAFDYKYHITGDYTPLTYEEEYTYWIEHKRHAEISNPLLARYDYYHGVAQGSPISPLLSTLTLTNLLLLNPHCQTVQYADDGILYNLTRCPSEILNFPAHTGIKVHWGKSRWIRRNGEWLHPLKFLGLKFNPLTLETTKDVPANSVRQGGTLSNATRTPKPFTYSDYDSIETAWNHDKKVSPWPADENNPSFTDWIKTGYVGYVHACLYAGRRDIPQLTQDFSYRYLHHSWSGLETRTNMQIIARGSTRVKLDVFVSSSFAHRSIANRIHKCLVRRPINGFRY